MSDKMRKLLKESGKLKYMIRKAENKNPINRLLKLLRKKHKKMDQKSSLI